MKHHSDRPRLTPLRRSVSARAVMLDALKTVLILGFTVMVTEWLYMLGLFRESVIIIYVLSILIISRVTSGYVFGVAAAVAGGLLYSFLITPPRMNFNLTPGFPLSLAIMLAVSLSTSAMTVQLKKQSTVAMEREGRAKMLYELSRALNSAARSEMIAELTVQYLAEHFDRSVIFYLSDPAEPDTRTEYRLLSPGDKAFFDLPSELETVHTIFSLQPSGTQSLQPSAGADVLYIPVVSPQEVLGVIGMRSGDGAPDKGTLSFLHMLASQAAFAIELRRVSKKQRQTMLQAEQEKLRGNLLRAISHDLRTPLTCISGCSTLLLEQGDRIDRETRDKLVLDIKEDSEWLIQMVENLLSVTKLQGNAMTVKTSVEAAEEVVAEAVSLMRKRFPGREFRVGAPDRLLMVPMDSTLIIQVLINLMENAVKHSAPDTPVFVNLSRENCFAVFEVLDHGEGIRGAVLPDLFCAHFIEEKRAESSSRGFGIGLSICKSIIQAHNGTIVGTNAEAGGAVFRFRLPLELQK